MIESSFLILLTVIGLWFCYFFAWRPYRLDRTRQDLFRLRDDLFIFWHKNNLPFDAEAYRMVRETLNGMIRFTHRMNIMRIVVMILADQKISGGQCGDRFEKELLNAINELSPVARRKLNLVRRQMHAIVLQHLVFHSALWSCCYWVIRALHLTKKLTRIVLSRKDNWSAFEAEVIDCH